MYLSNNIMKSLIQRLTKLLKALVYNMCVLMKSLVKLLSLRESRRPFLGCSAFLWNCIGSLSPLLSLSRSLGGHVWNHLVSQKTWQNNEEDKCNVKSAKRGE